MHPFSEFLSEAGFTSFAAGQGDVRIFLAGLVQAALSVVGIIFFLVVLWGGYMWITASGNEEQLKKARIFIINGIIGLVIAIAAMIITRTVVGFIRAASGPQRGGAPSGETLFDTTYTDFGN